MVGSYFQKGLKIGVISVEMLFIEKIKHSLNNDLEFLVHNFEGNTSNGLLMAQSLQRNKNLSCIFAIATPAAQLAVKMEQEKPIFIAAVTNPNILTADHALPKNLFGTTDMISINDQVAAIKTLLPTMRKVSILFNQAEANSNFLQLQMQKIFTENDFIVKSVAITSEAELGNQVKFACSNADLIIAPTDNMVATAAPFIASLCKEAKIPFIVSDPLLIQHGALFAAGGVDYKKSGSLAGAMAANLLMGIKPSVNFENALQTKILVNRATMKLLGLNFDSSATIEFAN